MKRFILREFERDDASSFIACHCDPKFQERCGPEEAVPGHAAKVLDTFHAWAHRHRANHHFQTPNRRVITMDLRYS